LDSYLIPVWFLFDSCRIPVGFLSHSCRIPVRFLSDSCRIPVGFLSDSCLIPVWFLSDSCLIPVWFLSDSCLIPVWFLSDLWHKRLNFRQKTFYLEIEKFYEFQIVFTFSSFVANPVCKWFFPNHLLLFSYHNRYAH